MHQPALATTTTARNAWRRAFTFMEVMIVVVIIGILAAMVVPRFANATQDAKLSSLKATLADVRAAIANEYAKSMIAGTPAYPADAAAVEALFPNSFPKNPYVPTAENVADASETDAMNRELQAAKFAWAYFADNARVPPIAIFYCNHGDKVTDVTTGESVILSDL